MQISINNFQPLNSCPKPKQHISRYDNNKFKYTQPPVICCCYSTTSTNRDIAKGCGTRSILSFSGVNENGIWLNMRRKRMLIMVKSNNGGGRINGETARVLGNLGVAIILTYLSMTGQLGWLLDAIISIWLIVVLVPIVGIGAFLWWAGRDIVQGSCPNCGNKFQVFKSTLNDELQLCPFCTQPFSVVGNEFVSEPVKFSNQSTTFDQGVGDFSARKKKGQDSSMAVVDVEAEVRDAE